MALSLDHLVIATSNEHKFKEICSILHEPGIKFLSLRDFPEIPAIEETGDSFQSNALLKARTVYTHTTIVTLADDSGLEVDALQGAPGIYSARYAGYDRNYAANNRKLLEVMENITDDRRGAQFRCVVAIVGPGTEEIVEGIVRGKIGHQPRGTAGFGYDPLFIPEGFTETYAEMGEELKNRISHRSQAFNKARVYLEKFKG
jgi:XTP/dITP diphosphohydrolase